MAVYIAKNSIKYFDSIKGIKIWQLVSKGSISPGNLKTVHLCLNPKK